VEDGGDLLLGMAQRAGKWTTIACSLAVRGLGGALAVGLALAATRDLRAALLAGLFWQAGVTFLHDWPQVRDQVGRLELPSRSDVAAALGTYTPLGAAAALVSLNAYIPRFAVERYLGIEAVGAFTALAQIALAGNMAVQAVGQAAVAPLGRAYAAGARPFLRQTAGLLVFALLCGAAGVAAAVVAGPQVLALLYRPEYAAYGDELVWMMAAAAFTYFTATLGYALVASGEHRMQLWVFGASAATALAVSVAMTPAWGMLGAAGALLASWIVAAAGAAVALALRIGAWRRLAAWRKLSGWNSPEAARRGAVR
jgi:O-antigen/teichoic acid export membrane protein